MRIYIRYFRPMVFGNYTTLIFDDVNPEEVLVMELKRKIFLRMRVEARHQKLLVRVDSSLHEMKNDNTLAFYKVNDKTPIYLENLQSAAKIDHENDEDLKQELDVSKPNIL